MQLDEEDSDDNTNNKRGEKGDGTDEMEGHGRVVGGLDRVSFAHGEDTDRRVCVERGKEREREREGKKRRMQQTVAVLTRRLDRLSPPEPRGFYI